MREGEISVQTIGVRNMKQHEAYKAGTSENAIALIRLARKVDFSISVHPICLPPAGKNITDTKAVVTGKMYIASHLKMSQV